MDKKFQVFVSSTYVDLVEERQEVMQALLELDCIPVGMEMFPAADDDQWTLIKNLIGDCDYYLLIQGGRYGSIGPDGNSYTQMEYEYALSKGLPIISFLHSDPSKIESGKTDDDHALKEKLQEFRSLTQKKMCSFWDNPSDLGSKVSRSLVKLIKNKPQTGWIRANVASSEEANREMIQLRKKIVELESLLEEARVSAPVGSEGLSQGQEEFKLRFNYYFRRECEKELKFSWNLLFYLLSPLMLDETTEEALKRELGDYIKTKIGDSPSKINIDSVCFQSIKVQFITLGLIARSEKKRSIKDNSTYWRLTPYGETRMMQLRAIKS